MLFNYKTKVKNIPTRTMDPMSAENALDIFNLSSHSNKQQNPENFLVVSIKNLMFQGPSLS